MKMIAVLTFYIIRCINRIISRPAVQPEKILFFRRQYVSQRNLSQISPYFHMDLRQPIITEQQSGGDPPITAASCFTALHTVGPKILEPSKRTLTGQIPLLHPVPSIKDIAVPNLSIPCQRKTIVFIRSGFPVFATVRPLHL